MERIEMLLQDEAFVSKMAECKTITELTQLFAENGAELTEDEVLELAKQGAAEAKGGELDEADLDNVAGGLRIFGFKISNPFTAIGKKLGTGLGNYWENLIYSKLK